MKVIAPKHNARPRGDYQLPLQLEAKTVKLTLKRVNAALAAKGIAERLVQGRGYLYFTDGDSHKWYSSSVAVCWLNHLTLEQWLAEHRELATSWQNFEGLTEAQYDAKYNKEAV